MENEVKGNNSKPPIDSFFSWEKEEDGNNSLTNQDSTNGPEFRDFKKWIDILASRVPVLAQQLGKERAAQIQALQEMEFSQGQITYRGVNSDEDDEVNPSVPLPEN